MVTSLENMGIVPLQFRLDGTRPDLTKLDALLGLLASESALFYEQVKSLCPILEKAGIKAVLEQLAIPVVPQVVPASASAPASAPAPVHVDAPKPKKPEGEGFCVVCMERPSDTALLECGHLSFCSRCADSLIGKQCPMCRAPVVRAIKIFKAST